MDTVDLTPMQLDCLRCGRSSPLRVPGLCEPCRDELAERFAPNAREIAAERYEPAMHVTPNAVALKDD